MTPAPLLVSGFTLSLHLREQDTLVCTILSPDCIYQASVPGASPSPAWAGPKLETTSTSPPCWTGNAPLQPHGAAEQDVVVVTWDGQRGRSSSTAWGALSVTLQLPPVFSHPKKPSPSSAWGVQVSHPTVRGTPITEAGKSWQEADGPTKHHPAVPWSYSCNQAARCWPEALTAGRRF